MEKSLFQSLGIGVKILLILFIVFGFLQIILSAPVSYLFGILASLCFIVAIIIYYKNKNKAN